ncbi:7,8-didemethyl-8-hydroxy-5-deazariboflavin synthase CofG [Curtobacterium sp. MCBD17_019]|uniref:7,8-didemethyl-8-hydroxy-5-deazariboflavin synthase CofG n=1 Tax=Curtobacterium sp. MCBD17_019 TaxID=2175669 RepID=UPI000DA73869|nr:7,8-didemethyl-8-hydroxy-5-deazariboflavin synthase CofG [Curtobacterium sp. MCBD17_019]PZE75140.1 7,8-didemethyl-8-hydroxy-5-deazariboflavin synthase subunit CofG [Curtobacterium sp. MCBD17_019]
MTVPTSVPVPTAVPIPDWRAPGSPALDRALDRAESDEPIDVDDATALLGARGRDLDRLLAVASRMRDAGLERAGRAGVITYSKKVFLPITQLCRDRCHYCVFVDTPGGLATRGIPTYMEPEAILAIARAGADMGCKEALFTLGDRPEDRWRAARTWLADHGYDSTLDYVHAMARLVREETGLVPHLNPGVMSWAEMQRLRSVAGSMGMMLETTATRLWSEPGGVHHGSPDKDPALRLRVIEDAGRSRIPFTTGVLLGIGEDHHDRAEALFAIRGLHERYGHVQETIVQNFRAKPRTAMQNEPDLGLVEYVAAVAVARVVMGPDTTVQAPPNLTDAAELDLLVRAGVDDWGGVSPLTADHVNPERPWPELDTLADLTARSGYTLRERLTAHPRYLADADRWLDDAVRPALEALQDPVTRLADEQAPVRGRSATRDDGAPVRLGRDAAAPPVGDPRVDAALAAATVAVGTDPSAITDEDAAVLLTARGAQLDALAELADRVRAAAGLDAVTHVVNRNIDTARLVGDDHEAGKGDGLTVEDVAALAAEAAALGATEVCLQGRPDPALPAAVYTDVVRAVRRAAPALSVHAFRPPELVDGAARAGVDLPGFLRMLRDAGVTSVPGTAARVLDDDVRAVLSEGQDSPATTWSETISAAHAAGLPSTATLVYGHVETPEQVVAHLRTIARVQDRTGGLTEFIPMPFVPADAPAAVAAVAGPGPTPSESRAVIAVARLLLAGRIDHVQAAWTKLGLATAADVLRGGADDVGGVLLDGALRPSAGPEAGLVLERRDLEALAAAAGRPLRERRTDYGAVTREGEGSPA